MSIIRGATYDESAVLEGQDQETLERLSVAGFRSLELALHPCALDLGRAGTLVKNGTSLGFTFAFHAPDFAEPGAFDLNYVMAPGGSRSAFKAWIDQCGDFGEAIQLVFHGASSEADTFRFVDFALEWIEQSRGSQVLLLENTFAKSPADVRFGQTHEALSAVMQAFSGSNLGLCLDTAHWLRAVNNGVFPTKSARLNEVCETSTCATDCVSDSFEVPEQLLRDIRRVHIHSVEPLTGRDHQGLSGRDAATAQLLAPWASGSAALAPHVRKTCVLSAEVLASCLTEAKWLDTVLSSGEWLRGLYANPTTF